MNTEPTLQTKQSGNVWNGSEWVAGKGATLYRFVSDERDERSGIWHSTTEQAERSWRRRHPEAA